MTCRPSLRFRLWLGALLLAMQMLVRLLRLLLGEATENDSLKGGSVTE